MAARMAIGLITALEVALIGGGAIAERSSPSAGAAAAPDAEGRIAFDRFDATAGAEGEYLGGFITDADGANERRIALPFTVFELEPTWSPDGRRLMVNTISEAVDHVLPATVDADGGDFQPIEVDTDLHLFCSDWSPDGTTLLCSGAADGRPDTDGLYTVRVDGGGPTRLSSSPYHYAEGSAGQCGGGQGRGVYSPDGSTIAFIEQRCGTGPNPSSDETAAIVTIRSDGTERREIVAQGGVMSHPGSQLSWSADGAWIAFNTLDGRLHLVHPDGSGLATIPIDGGWDGRWAMGPDWSPDGSRILFSMYQEAEGSSDLYTIAADGSDLQRVTDAPGAEAWARWRPVVDSSMPASPRPPCPNPEGGACLGRLPAGTYSTTAFRTTMTYTVPDGWRNYEDLPGQVLLVPPGGSLEGVNPGTSDFVGVFDGVAPASADCEEHAQLGIDPTVEAMAAWYATREGLATSGPTPVSVGGLDGVVLDLRIAEGFTGGCPYDGFEGVPMVPLIFGVPPANLHHVVMGDIATRLYLLRGPEDGTTGIEIVDVPGGDTLAAMDAVVGTIRFDLPAPPATGTVGSDGGLPEGRWRHPWWPWHPAQGRSHRLAGLRPRAITGCLDTQPAGRVGDQPGWDDRDRRLAPHQRQPRSGATYRRIDSMAWAL